MEECIFCAIVRADVPSYRVWDDAEHLAFLDINPNIRGQTLVITRVHEPSDVLQLPEPTFARLMEASRQVAALLRNYFDDVGRVALVAEGFGVDHVHVKLYPLHGTPKTSWRQIIADTRRSFDQYPGYLTTELGPPADPHELSELAASIRKT